MKKYLFIYFILTSIACSAQVTSISENFDVACGSSSTLLNPAGWHEYNVITDVDSLKWRCSATHGRDGTPGMRCLGYYSGAYHFDSAWLFTPLFSIGGYSDSIFLRFDSKFEVGVAYFKLSVHLIKDSTTSLGSVNPSFDTTISDLTSVCTPVISNADSFGWVTHQLNLTPYKISHPTIAVAFRYTSTDTAAGAWALDNIYTTPISLYVPDVKSNSCILSLCAVYDNEHLNITYSTPQAGTYNLAMYDITGREVLRQNIESIGGKETRSINSHNLQKGLYILKLYNENSVGIAKVVVY